MHHLDFIAHRLPGFKLTAYPKRSIFRSILVTGMITCSLTSYSSVKQGTNEIVTNEETVTLDDHLKKVELPVGFGTKTHFVSEKYIAGLDVAALDHTRTSEFNALLRYLGIKRQPSTKGAGSLTLFELNKYSRISFESALSALRNRFGYSFGPALYDQDKLFKGALQNQIRIKFSEDVSLVDQRIRIDSLRASHTNYQVVDRSYVLTFSDSKDISILEISDELKDLNQIVWVENKFFSLDQTTINYDAVQLTSIQICSGKDLQEAFIDKRLLGTMLQNKHTEIPGIDSVFRKYNLRWSELPIQKPSVINHHAVPRTNYRFIEHIANVDSAQEGLALEELRSYYASGFGPVLLYSETRVRGILSNRLIVYLDPETSREDGEKLLKKYGAIKFSFREQYEFRYFYVDFPLSVGYEIIDLAKTLLALDEFDHVYHDIIAPVHTTN